jgi:hypothetical protein
VLKHEAEVWQLSNQIANTTRLRRGGRRRRGVLSDVSSEVCSEVSSEVIVCGNWCEVCSKVVVLHRGLQIRRRGSWWKIIERIVESRSCSNALQATHARTKR